MERLFMVRLITALGALSLLLFTSAGAYAQESTPPAAEQRYFPSLAGYIGGADVSFTRDSVDPTGLLVVSSGMAQFETVADATAAISTINNTYVDYLKKADRNGFDFTGVVKTDAPQLGDESTTLAGTVLGLEGNPDLNVNATFVRIGSVLFGIQGVSLLGNPTNDVLLLLEELISRNPQPAPTPIDGTSPDAAIWTWLTTHADLDDRFTMQSRTWTNADGTETAIQPFPPESD